MLQDTATPLKSKKEAARYFGTSVATIDRLMAARVLGFVKVGHLTRFREEDLLAYIRANARAGGVKA
jgi:excisionase family DNA binding protein